ADMSIGAEEIFVTVVVEIENARAPAAHLKALESNAGGVGLFAKEAMALIIEKGEGLASEGGHENARPAGIGPVSRDGSPASGVGPIARVRHLGLNADIFGSLAVHMFQQE